MAIDVFKIYPKTSTIEHIRTEHDTEMYDETRYGNLFTIDIFINNLVNIYSRLKFGIIYVRIDRNVKNRNEILDVISKIFKETF